MHSWYKSGESVFVESHEQRLTKSHRGRAQIAGGAEQEGEQRFVVGPVFFHIEVDDFLSSRDNDMRGVMSQMQGLIRPLFFLAGIGDRFDGNGMFLKEPLSFLAGRSALTVV